jgi:FixJ family two-component response regulator
VILIIDDDAGFSRAVAEVLLSEEFEVERLATLDAALARVTPGSVVFRMEGGLIAEVGVRLEVKALLARQAG